MGTQADGCAQIIVVGGLFIGGIFHAISNIPTVVFAGYDVRTTPTENKAFESEEVKKQFRTLTYDMFTRHAVPRLNCKNTIERIYAAIDDPAYQSRNVITMAEMENAQSNLDTIEKIVFKR